MHYGTKYYCVFCEIEFTEDKTLHDVHGWKICPVCHSYLGTKSLEKSEVKSS